MKGDFTRFTHDPTKHYTGVLKQQGRVDLDADWNEYVEIQQRLKQTTNQDVIGSRGAPKHRDGFGIEVTPPEDGLFDLTISPGRIYVDGILCELEEETSYLCQPDYYPDLPSLEPQEGRTDLVYLDVWQRHVTAIEDPDIREVALGGPDTTTRVKTVWQVKVQKGVGEVTCEGMIAGWPPSPSGARLSTRAVLPPDDEKPCIIAPGGGYGGLENRLYRVEIHEGSDSEAGPTFKWSRDNGSVVFAIEEFVAGEPDKVRVKCLGKDQVLALRVDDWVEVLDDATELSGEAGTLAQIVPGGIDEAERILTLSQPISGYDLARHPKVRRWDQNSDAIPVTTDPIELEDGIEISFSGNNFKTGDYWVFAARAATGTVEELVEAPPHGIEHHYSRLLLFTWGRVSFESVVVIDPQDCRPTFPPLSAITADDVSFDDSVCDMGAQTVQEALEVLCQRPSGGHEPYWVLRYLGGDGQEGRRGETLPCTLAVGVEDENGRPVELVDVNFTAPNGHTLLHSSLGSGRSLVVPTSGGVAEVEWQLSANAEPGCHQVTARLQHLPPQGGAFSVHFKATVREVGEAPETETWPQVEDISWHNDQPLSRSVFNQGLQVTFSEEMDQDTASLDTFIVTLELPTEGHESYPGHRIFIVPGKVVVSEDRKTWTFSPEPEIPLDVLRDWLGKEKELFKVEEARIRCRVVLKGNVILSVEEDRPLDGDVFGTVTSDSGGDYIDLILPSHDGNKGGDFESWFYLVLDSEFESPEEPTPPEDFTPSPPPEGTKEPPPEGTTELPPLEARSSELYVNEVRGIGPVYAGRLEVGGVVTLDQLASMEPKPIAELMGVSEVRAMGFIDEARRLLAESVIQGKLA